MSCCVTRVMPSVWMSFSPTNVRNASETRIWSLWADSMPSMSRVGSASAYPSPCAPASTSEQSGGVGRQRQRLEVQPLARARQVRVGDGGQHEPCAGALLEHRAAGLEDLHDAAADGAEPEQPDPDILHPPRPSRGGCACQRPSCLIPRSACLIRR